MCGICGHFRTTTDEPVDRLLMERMNETLQHRGPNSGGLYVDGPIGLAMRRLAIIDVAGGQQPISNEDETVWVVFNGEIYNFLEIRDDLLQRGHRFGTDSDTEVIVHAYEEWGDDAIVRFNGMFAFSLWDSRRQRLLLARDRMGQKPLYWHYSDHGLLWASEAKAILRAPWVERRINPQALHHYLTLQYTPDPLTIYQEIHQLPAAHKLVIERTGQPQLSQWWQLPFEPKHTMSEREIVAHAQDSLRRAVRRRLISEVPLGLFLSGGMDSSIIAALMAEETSAPVKTFSIGFEERFYSETRYARQVAERYQTEHYEFVFQPGDLIRVIEGVVESIDEPLADPAALPLYELARHTSKHVTVALCGDGGDETVAGYRRYALDGLMQPYAGLPSWLTQRVVPSIADHIPEPAWIPEDRNPITGLKRLGQFSATTPKASLVRWGSYFTHDDKLALYTDRWREELSVTYTADWIANAYDQAVANTLLDATLRADQVTYLAGDLLQKSDHTTMAHSIETRSPFLDPEWVEWTARLPAKYKVRWLTTKWLLRAAFADKLPKEVAARGKQGFSVPVGVWIKNELRDWTYARLIDNADLNEWFDPKAIRQILVEHESGNINHGKRIWALLLFAVWLERYY